MNRLEEAQKAFLKVRNILTEKHEDFALAKAYKLRPFWHIIFICFSLCTLKN